MPQTGYTRRYVAGRLCRVPRYSNSPLSRFPSGQFSLLFLTKMAPSLNLSFSGKAGWLPSRTVANAICRLVPQTLDAGSGASLREMVRRGSGLLQSSSRCRRPLPLGSVVSLQPSEATTRTVSFRKYQGKTCWRIVTFVEFLAQSKTMSQPSKKEFHRNTAHRDLILHTNRKNETKCIAIYKRKLNALNANKYSNALYYVMCVNCQTTRCSFRQQNVGGRVRNQVCVESFRQPRVWLFFRLFFFATF